MSVLTPRVRTNFVAFPLARTRSLFLLASVSLRFLAHAGRVLGLQEGGLSVPFVCLFLVACSGPRPLRALEFLQLRPVRGLVFCQECSGFWRSFYVLNLFV